MDDAALAVRVAKAQLGDPRALDDVLRAIQLPILRHVRAIVEDDDRGWDVVQTTLLTVARHLSQLHDPRLIRPWAFRIAHRAAVKALTRERRDALRAVAPMAEPAAPDAEDFRWDKVSGDVEALPPATRVVIEMHYVEGMPLWEIAEVLELPLGTVKSRLSYGLSSLRRKNPRPPDRTA